jgi:Mannosyl-glycoprotein endo-beta-N-acetylglucosaminidase
VRLIGPPSADRNLTLNQAMHALGAHTRFGLDMFPALWDAGVELVIDPVIVVAQAYKETGGGRFGGKVKPEACNPCGLKIRTPGIYGPATDGDEPAAHAIFPNWQIGARAQVEHLRAYAGWPVPGPVVDPRYAYALKTPAGWCENVEDLGGKWAPAADYGTSIAAIARRLQGRAA